MADDDTLRAWRAGDAAAGRALVDAHFEAVFRFFRNKCNEDVEDLVQTTFAKCLAGADAFRGQASVRTYLLTIARNELYDHWSRRRRDGGNVDVGSVSVEDMAPSPGTQIAARDDRLRLAQALRMLPVDLQVALELHYWEELTGPELAEVLGVPEGTARSRLRRGREELQRIFAELETEAPPHPREGDLDAWVTALKASMSR